MDCIQCGRSFAEEDRIAAISGSIMGDEHTDVYYLCPVCRVYTVAKWWDNFTGVESMELDGPLSEAEGNARVEIIERCARPWNKKCRCKAHCEYFNDTLD